MYVLARSGLAALLFLCAVAPASGERLRQITEFDVRRLFDHAVNDAGSLAYFVSDIDPFGTNPSVVRQVFRRTLPGGALEQITVLDDDAYQLSVSDDGSAVLFLSSADPLGLNADRGRELFLAAGDGSALLQLTSLADGSGEIHSAVLSGNGTAVVFVSDGNLTGGNPAGDRQVFVVNGDGSGLLQLTTASDPACVGGVEVSDAAHRILFISTCDLTGGNPDGSSELFRIQSGGTGLAQVTSDENVWDAVLSGDGRTIVYNDDAARLWAIDWGASTAFFLADGTQPSIRDDGKAAVYRSNGSSGSIYAVDTTGGPPTQIWAPGINRRPILAGSGTRVFFELSGQGTPFPTDPDAVELMAIDPDGSAPESVINVGENGAVYSFEMSADGRWIIFPWGAGGAFREALDLYLADVDEPDVRAVTDGAWAANPAISDDGQTIVFTSYADLLPGSCGDLKVYRVDADGAGLQQLIPDCPSGSPSYPDHPMVSGDGAWVVVDSGQELYTVSASGGTISLVTQDGDSTRKNPRIDGDGTWVTYGSGADPLGQNPGGGAEVFRARRDGTTLEQVTVDDATYQSLRPDISADGARVVYLSTSDPLGQNPDHNQEIFLHDTVSGTTNQLTQSTAGDNTIPRISPNGAFVAFYSGVNWVDPGLDEEIYRIEVATSNIRLASAGIGVATTTLSENTPMDIDDAGNVAFYSTGDLIGRNPDGSRELWLAEFDETASLDIGTGIPTEIRWDPSPSSLTYDVIRGAVAQLSAGPGGTIDLGTVVCVEEDSGNAIASDDSPDGQPGSGQTWFYLHREFRGALVATGSWGAGSGGDERIPSSGSCAAP